MGALSIDALSIGALPLGALLAEEGFGLDDLIRAVVVITFLVLPAIKNARKARGQRDAGPDSAPSTDQEAAEQLARERQREATEQWERLMSGEQPEVESEPLDEVEPWEPEPEPVLEQQAPLSDHQHVALLSGEPARPLSERELEPEFGSLGRAPADAVLAAPQAASSTIESKAFRSLSEAVSSSGHHAVQPRARAVARAAARRSLRAPGWRRAVVLSEVLSAPLALRKDPSWMGRR